jgi:opacity protein-like surface antigen
MITIRSAFAAAAALVASMWAAVAVAQSDYRDWYVGFSGETTHPEVFRDPAWEAGADETGFSLRGGLRLTKGFAIEFAAQHADDLEWTEHFASVAGHPGFYDATTTFDVTALQVNAVGIAPFGRIFEGIFKGGLAQYNLSGRRTLDDVYGPATLSQNVSDEGFGYLLGLGLAVYATPKWRVRLEYQFFDIDQDFLALAYGDDASIDTVTLGVDYRLGGREP